MGVTRTEEGLPVRTVLERDAVLTSRAGRTERMSSSSKAFQCSKLPVNALMVTRMKKKNIDISNGDIVFTSNNDQMFCVEVTISHRKLH